MKGEAMRAVVLHARGDLRVEERARPHPGPGEVLLRVTAAGVCGSDAGELDHGPVLTPLTTPHPVTRHEGPLVLGHEIGGRVEILGPGVAGLRIGQLVACGAGVSCGRCDHCAAGRTNLCDRYWTLGLSTHGGLAEYVVAPASVCLPVDPDRVSEHAAGLVQPMSIAVHASRCGRPTSDDHVVVVGAGGIGAFLVAALAQHTGPRSLRLVEPNPARREVALGLGATSAHEDAGSLRAAAAPVDVVYEVSGTPAGLRTALGTVRRGGRVVLVGLQRPGTAPDDLLLDVSRTELELVGTNAHTFAADFTVAAELIARRGDWSLVAPRVHPLEAAATVVDALAHGGGTTIKELFDPRVGRPVEAGYGTA
ncbi:zinc-binding dehydrogenase [Pseudonocardia lutea]|uniref:Zinc-binding dehydrogenase n=1 Tax=Pseudonocardia lutea TaxID=2172015 RepID=A0ABW1I474_9PSEU